MKSISILLLILLPTIGLCKNKYSKGHDYSTLSIIPEIGGAANFVQSQSNENKFFYGYNLGCNIELRPLTNFGLTSGYTYNKFINSINYSEMPILINYFTNNDLIFMAGPVIYFNPNAKQYGSPDPSVGVALGMGKPGFKFLLYLNENHPLLNLVENMKYFVGIGIRIDLFRFNVIK